jgi:argininosuccinate lyase
MMPNKRNPDPAELVRGRAAGSIAALTAMLGILKGLPLAYQRDLQDDKPLLFGTVATFEASLGVMSGLVETLSIDAARMRAAADEGFTTATAVADALVGHGLAFRSAHHVVGALVAAAEARGAGLAAVTDKEVASALRGIDDEVAVALAMDAGRGVGDVVRSAASVEGAIAAADVIGGTAPARVGAALAAARERLGPA